MVSCDESVPPFFSLCLGKAPFGGGCCMVVCVLSALLFVAVDIPFELISFTGFCIGSLFD